MVNLKTLLRRAGLAGAPDRNRTEAPPAPEKFLRGGLQRRPTPAGGSEQWQPPTKGTTVADRKRIRRRAARAARAARRAERLA